MILRTALLLALMASSCLAQNPMRMQQAKLPGGVSCQVPMDWIIDPVQGEPGADAQRPHALFEAHPMIPLEMGLSRGSRVTSLTISRWPATVPVTAFDPARNPLDMPETFALRQELALEGFFIANAWTAGSNDGDVRVVASTYVGTMGRESRWVVETTTWQDHDVIYAAQLRYPEQIPGNARLLIMDIKTSVRYKDLPGSAFVSGYTMPEGSAGVAARTPSGGMPGMPQIAPTVTSRPPQTVVPVPVAVPPAVPAAMQADAVAVVRRASSSLVLVQGKEKAGSAFVCNMAGQKFMVTNAHVLSGNTGVNLKPFDRTPFQTGAAGAAVNHDLMRLVVTSANPALEILDDLSANLTAGDDVLVLGNAEGAQVINPIAGKVVGIGPDLVEVDAPFVSGNSGSPIIQVRTGKVIGVATYTITRELSTLADGTKEKKVRRFGYRLDSVAAWQPVNWAKFNAEAASLQRVEELTQDLASLWKGIADDGHIHAGVQQNAALRRATQDYVQATQGSTRVSSADILKTKQSFLSTVESLCKGDLVVLRPTLSYDYFQRKAADEQEIRDEFFKGFDQLFKMQTENTQRRNN